MVYVKMVSDPVGSILTIAEALFGDYFTVLRHIHVILS